MDFFRHVGTSEGDINVLNMLLNTSDLYWLTSFRDLHRSAPVLPHRASGPQWSLTSGEGSPFLLLLLQQALSSSSGDENTTSSLPAGPVQSRSQVPDAGAAVYGLQSVPAVPTGTRQHTLLSCTLSWSECPGCEISSQTVSKADCTDWRLPVVCNP